jgi:hypothetical protein
MACCILECLFGKCTSRKYNKIEHDSEGPGNTKKIFTAMQIINDAASLDKPLMGHADSVHSGSWSPKGDSSSFRENSVFVFGVPFSSNSVSAAKDVS